MESLDKRDSSSLKRALMDCDLRRKSIEKEMEDIEASLLSPVYLSVGIHKPLIDKDGFPISGIDLHDIRTRRNRFAMLSSDLRYIEAELSELLHRLHENARVSGTIERGQTKCLLPFGKVSEVMAESPADCAGLVTGDKIVRFGNLHTTTDEGVAICYNSIPSVVQNYPRDKALEVHVLRRGREHDAIVAHVDLTGGKLGCLITKV